MMNRSGACHGLAGLLFLVHFCAATPASLAAGENRVDPPAMLAAHQGWREKVGVRGSAISKHVRTGNERSHSELYGSLQTIRIFVPYAHFSLIPRPGIRSRVS